MYKGHKGYKKIILQYLDSQPSRWFKSYELQCVPTPFGWIGLRGTRDCRDLASKGKIKVSHDRSDYAEYRSVELPPPLKVEKRYQVERINQLTLTL